MKKKKLTLVIIALMFSPGQNLLSWERAIAGLVTSPPAQGLDGRIYCTADDRALHCLDSEEGREHWLCRPGRKIGGFTVVSPDGSILVRDDKDVLICISPGGHVLWRFPLKESLLVPPAVDSYGSIYLLGKNRTLYCLNRTGTLSWKKILDFEARDFFTAFQKLFLMAKDETLVLHIDGQDCRRIVKGAASFIYADSRLYWEEPGGRWWIVDSSSLALSSAPSPLQRREVFPNAACLITREGKVLAGRKDWFIEVMEEGEEAYNPYYQEGGNPGRTRGMEWGEGKQEESASYGIPGQGFGLSYLENGSSLDAFLNFCEKNRSFQEMLLLNPHYDKQLFYLLTGGSLTREPPPGKKEMDHYQRCRIYALLGRWGNLNCYNALLLLAEKEQDGSALSLIISGLGRIGRDPEGRGMRAIRKICQRRQEPELIQTALNSALRIARFNGGASMEEFLLFFEEVQKRGLPRGFSDQFLKNLRSF